MTQLPSLPTYVNWSEVAQAISAPGGVITDLTAPNHHPLARFNAENFGHQGSPHIGGVPGRIGGCTSALRYGMYGRNSREFWTYKGAFTIVHDDPGELAYLLVGEGTVRQVPRSIDPQDTIWIKDHPDFQSVRWPLQRSDFVADTAHERTIPLV
jgi:hypothetical protein